MIAREAIHLARPAGQRAAAHQRRIRPAEGEDALDEIAHGDLWAAADVQDRARGRRRGAEGQPPRHVVDEVHLAGLAAVGHGEGATGQRRVDAILHRLRRRAP